MSLYSYSAYTLVNGPLLLEVPPYNGGWGRVCVCDWTARFELLSAPAVRVAVGAPSPFPRVPRLIKHLPFLYPVCCRRLLAHSLL